MQKQKKITILETVIRAQGPIAAPIPEVRPISAIIEVVTILTRIALLKKDNALTKIITLKEVQAALTAGQAHQEATVLTPLHERVRPAEAVLLALLEALVQVEAQPLVAALDLLLAVVVAPLLLLEVAEAVVHQEVLAVVQEVAALEAADIN